MLLTIFIYVTFNIQAQRRKVNYDEIYPLLIAKQYKIAEPFLKEYIKQNAQNANAYLFLGFIFQDKLSTTDDPVKLINFMDSAVYCFNKAISNLSVSQLKANEKYYEVYSRRDLRTGKIEIKFEDVIFDLNTRKNGLNNELLKSCRTNIDDQLITFSDKNATSKLPLIKSSGEILCASNWHF